MLTFHQTDQAANARCGPSSLHVEALSNSSRVTTLMQNDVFGEYSPHALTLAAAASADRILKGPPFPAHPIREQFSQRLENPRRSSHIVYSTLLYFSWRYL